MSQHRILSIDTAYDNILRLFSTNRRGYYQTLDTDLDYHVTPLVGNAISHDNFLEQCGLVDADGLPFYNCLTISSHGSSGVILHNAFGEIIPLLSEADSNETLQIVANGRAIYLLACKAADGYLLDRLMNNSARSVVGFSQDPSWGCKDSNNLWRSIDLQILSCFSEQNFAFAVTNIIASMMDVIENDLHEASVQYARDLMKIRGVLESIVII